MLNIIKRFLKKNIKFTSANQGRLRRLRERGQAVVITAVAFMAILAFMGLVTDVGTLYLNFTRLKRALDSAAVAAANNIKDSSIGTAQRKSNIQKAAREMLSFNEIEDISTMEVYTCTDSSIPTEFDDVCPDPGEKQRKLAWVQATQNSPLYFLRLFGINNIPITTHSIGEAATLDVVIVIDTSESMGSNTPSYGGDFDPDADCNDPGDPYYPCQPLNKAKVAAKLMVDKFFDGYDRVAVVNYDVRAHYIDPDCPGSIDTVCADGVVLDPKISKVKDAIDAIRLHDDIDHNEVMGGNPAAGDINPLDGNNDGTLGDSLVTTCTGCGIRLAGNILKNQGRIDSVWIIVFLSDGATNMTDLPPSELDPSSPVPATYPNGFCGGAINSRMWD
ncbi:MAG: VWA domain-containing protein, partial [Anaerolineales bacterium]|nr:VWA domain-containing protein [Anaerolineales bacterium]